MGDPQLVYVAEGLGQFIFSKEAWEPIGIIEKNFPAIGSYGNADINNISYSGGSRRPMRTIMLQVTSSLPLKRC